MQRSSVSQPSVVATRNLPTVSAPSTTTTQRPNIREIFSNLPNDLLNKRRPDEDPLSFQWRTNYTRIALELLPDELDETTALIVGEMALQATRYGVRYPQEYQQVIDYINQVIIHNG